MPGHRDTDEAREPRRIRRLILGRAALCGVLGVVPVPQVEDALRAAVRRGLLRRLSALRQVDIDEAALDALTAESENQQRLDNLLALGNLLLSLRKIPRRALVGALSLRRLDQVLRTYEQASLFDHYCSRHHLGPGIDVQQARRLRRDFDGAARDAHRALVSDAASAAAGGAFRLLSAAAERVVATVREQRLHAAPALLAAAASSARAVVGVAVSSARDGALSLRTRGPLAVLEPLAAGIDRYGGRLAAAFDRRSPVVRANSNEDRRGSK